MKKMKSVSVKVKMSILSLKQTRLGISYYVCIMSLQKIIAEEMTQTDLKLCFNKQWNTLFCNWVKM